MNKYKNHPEELTTTTLTQNFVTTGLNSTTLTTALLSRTVLKIGFQAAHLLIYIPETLC